MHFRGEGKTMNREWNGELLFYPMHFRGEGKTIYLVTTQPG